MENILSFGPGLIILLLGSFLLLASIVGGGLEIKEIKVPKIEKAPRILTGILGMMLMACGGSVGAFSLMLQLSEKDPPPENAPITIPGDYIPNTEDIVADNLQLPEQTGLPADVEKAVAELIVDANQAQILANFYQEPSYLNSYYSAYALQQLQYYIEEIKLHGYIQLDDFDIGRSYYVSMRLENNVLTIDECEYWKSYYYDPIDGNLVEESEWFLVPQTISMELVREQIYITAISFYQNNAFCTQ
jgi:hypothetical protein